MIKIIQVTDTHVVAEGHTLNGINPLRRLELAVDSINAEHADAEMVVFSGDLTNRGTTDSYTAFRKVAQKLTVPYTAMMGNHDENAEIEKYFPETPRDENGFVQYTVKKGNNTFIMCDTSSGLGNDGHHGVYCEKRCAWLSQQLADVDGDAYIFMHHPPVTTHTPVDNIKLKNDDAVYQAIAPYKDKVRFMFFGHTHRNTCGIWQGIPYKILASTCHQGTLDIGPAMGVYPINFESPSYGVILLDGGDMVYHTHIYASITPEISTPAKERAEMTEEQWETYCKNVIAKHPNWFDYE